MLETSSRERDTEIHGRNLHHFTHRQLFTHPRQPHEKKIAVKRLGFKFGRILVIPSDVQCTKQRTMYELLRYSSINTAGRAAATLLLNHAVGNVWRRGEYRCRTHFGLSVGACLA